MMVVFQTQDGCACAMLAVYLDNASNLPVSVLNDDILIPTIATNCHSYLNVISIP